MSETSANERPSRHFFYYFIFGFIAGATVIAVGLLQPPLAVVVPLVVAGAFVKLLDVIARRYSASPFSNRLDRSGIVYVSLLALATIGSLAVVWFLARPENEMWRVWLLAALMFVVVFVGAWFTQGRSAHKTPSAV